MTDAAHIAASLTPAQRDWVIYGPFAHWTNTTRALARKGIKPLVGVHSLNDLGEQVRAILRAQQEPSDGE